MERAPTPAEVQFNTSSNYHAPAGFKAWKIRNDYPPPPPDVEISGVGHIPRIPGQIPGDFPGFPWMKIDPRKEPGEYMRVIREYIFEGNIEHDFVVQENKVRDWYHAPWMHASPQGREPLHGLTFERPTPPQEFASTQTKDVQMWACGYFNSPAASVFGGVWKDPNTPQWDENIKFPHGSLVFKLLFAHATDEEIPILKGAPSWEALIALQPDTSVPPPDPSKRHKEPRHVKLIQMDFATRDERQPTGWIFGTFMYDGTGVHIEQHHHNLHYRKWSGLIPVGLMWGNDPELTQEKYEAGGKVEETWINPDAEAIRIKLGGKRPSWGWNGRLNGPADNFISACSSCHATSQNPMKSGMTVNPPPKQNSQGQWIPQDPNTMYWFRNVPAGVPFDEGCISGDYSLQLMIGFANYTVWKNSEVGIDAPLPRAHLLALRSGPRVEYH